jgi:hypothetical protein
MIAVSLSKHRFLDTKENVFHRIYLLPGGDTFVFVVLLIRRVSRTKAMRAHVVLCAIITNVTVSHGHPLSNTLTGLSRFFRVIIATEKLVYPVELSFAFNCK